MCSQSPTWLPNSLRVPKHRLLMTGNGSGPRTPMSSVHIGLPWLNGKNSQYDTWNFLRPHSVTYAYTGTRVAFGFCPYSTEVPLSNSCPAADGEKHGKKKIIRINDDVPIIGDRHRGQLCSANPNYTVRSTKSHRGLGQSTGGKWKTSSRLLAHTRRRSEGVSGLSSNPKET